VPQQNQLAGTVDLNNSLIKDQGKLKWDIKAFVQAKRLSGADKDKRDMLLYSIWQAGRPGNEKIGDLFGIS